MMGCSPLYCLILMIFSLRAHQMPNRRDGYRPSREKVLVTEQFDRPLIQHLSKSKDKKLAYVGLPGVDAVDLHSWRESLDQIVAVERNQSNFEQMRRNIRSQLPFIKSSFHLGDIDRAILWNTSKEGRGAVGNTWVESLQEWVWQFDIVYLDYFGSFLPEKARNPRAAIKNRINALHKLFECSRLDAWERWVLLLTVDTKMTDSLRMALRRHLEESKKGLPGGILQDLDFLLSEQSDVSVTNARLIRAACDTIVSRGSDKAGLRVIPRGSVLYSGSGGSRMLHISYECHPLENSSKRLSSLPAMLRAPFLQPRVDEGLPVRFLHNQSPGADRKSVEECLSFLGREMRESLTEELPR